MTQFNNDTRGASQVIGYILGLAVITLLIGTLLTGVNGFLDTQTEKAQQQGFEVIGQQVAADIEVVDGYVQETGGDDPITRESTNPDRIGASDYRIEITSQGTSLYQLRIFNTNSVEMTVTLRSFTPLEETTVDGGNIAIEYDPSQNKVVFNE